jgi:hypothetical protein
VNGIERGKGMTVSVMTVKLYAPWVQSLKEKKGDKTI